jgi:hypothetical protein
MGPELVFMIMASASAVASAAGSIQQGRVQNRMAQNEATIQEAEGDQARLDADGNVRIAQHNRRKAILKGKDELAWRRREDQVQRGALISNMVGSGLDVTSPSYQAILRSQVIDSGTEAQLALSDIRDQSSRFAFDERDMQQRGRRSQTLGYFQAAGTRSVGRSAQRTGQLGAGLALVQGGASMAQFQAGRASPTPAPAPAPSGGP